MSADTDIPAGSTGPLHHGQSFNETRAVNLTVLGASNRITESLTFRGLNIGAASSAIVGARIYDDTTQTLLAFSDVTVEGGNNNITVTISTTLISGRNYRVGFYVETTPLSKASGNLFLPASFSSITNPIPYTEATGIFRINSAHAIGSDTFPSNPNKYIPQLVIRTRCP